VPHSYNYYGAHSLLFRTYHIIFSLVFWRIQFSSERQIDAT